MLAFANTGGPGMVEGQLNMFSKTSFGGVKQI